jgi:hypothetical protein
VNLAEDFKDSEQHDAAEFIDRLLSLLHEGTFLALSLSLSLPSLKLAPILYYSPSPLPPICICICICLPMLCRYCTSSTVVSSFPDFDSFPAVLLFSSRPLPLPLPLLCLLSAMTRPAGPQDMAEHPPSSSSELTQKDVCMRVLVLPSI